VSNLQLGAVIQEHKAARALDKSGMHTHSWSRETIMSIRMNQSVHMKICLRIGDCWVFKEHAG
jgi:hypothetical protein